jgi:P27 family predicted phage terminase small subunit
MATPRRDGTVEQVHIFDVNRVSAECKGGWTDRVQSGVLGHSSEVPMRGRKPVPTPLKLLRGNPGKRPINGREPRPRAGAPACPPHLDAEAKAEWARVAPELEVCGVLTHLDRAALAAYCSAWSQVVTLEQKVQQFGEVLMNAAKGTAYRSPYAIALASARRQMLSFMSELGLTPAARSRIQLGGPAGDEDPAERFFRGRTG